jgi:hypothetical protein
VLAHALQRLSDQHLVFVGPVNLGRVEEGDAELDGPVKRGDRLLFGLAAIGEAHAHAAEADGGNGQLGAEFALVHDGSPFKRCDKHRRPIIIR